jgi:hypothetical protein
MRFQVFTAPKTWIEVFWLMTPRSLVRESYVNICDVGGLVGK